jgi:energy-coupling factor transport system permease protein
MSKIYLSLSYRPVRSPLMALDPRLRLGLGLGPLLLSLVSPASSSASISLALALLLAAAARSAKRLLRSLVYIALFAALLSLLSWAYGASYLDALTSGIRLLAFFSSASTMLMLVAPEELEHVLLWLRAPKEIALVLTAALRLAPKFALDLQNIADAQRARGVEHGSRNPFKRLRALSLLLIPLTELALRDAFELAQALEARGFGASARVTPPTSFRWKVQEAFLLAGYALALLLLGLLLR